MSPTSQRRSRLQHGYCIGVSHRSALTTVGKGLAQGPYVAARVGVEPTTLQLKVIDSTNAPPPRSFMQTFFSPSRDYHLNMFPICIILLSVIYVYFIFYIALFYSSSYTLPPAFNSFVHLLFLYIPSV